MRLKRLLCLLLCLCLTAVGTVWGLAEEDEDEDEEQESLSQQEEDEIRDLDTVDESMYQVTGRVWEEMNREDFDQNSPAVYIGKMRKGYSIWTKRATAKTDPTSVRLFTNNSELAAIDILYVGLQWMIVRRGKDIGYVKREWVAKSEIKAVDPVNTPPFNEQKHQYIATTATRCHVRRTMDPTTTSGDDGNNWVILNPGTMISIWQFYDGWAMVNYMRSYGYIDPHELKDLIPVSPTDEELYPDCPIAAYTSYYSMKDTETNHNRIHNIRVGCGYITNVYQPGEEFNANKIMGRYNAGKGYKKAGVLVEGETVQGYGGGTCQVSSTLYNVLIQLPRINITYRHPHGGNGASYLPIHCDAAVGNSKLNLKFINCYDFPIRVEGHTSDDGALLMVIYRDHSQDG